MLEKVDLTKKISKEEYKEKMPQLESKLGRLQRECKALGIPVLIVFEGFGAAGKGEAPFAHGEVLGIAHQVAHFLHRTHIGNDDAPRTQIQGMEHRRAGAVAHAHEGFRAVQLQGAYHFPCAFFGKGAVLRVDDHIVKAGKAETFRHDGTAEMAEGADHALPGVQLLIKGAQYFPLFSSTSRMSETASLRLSMELA